MWGRQGDLHSPRAAGRRGGIPETWNSPYSTEGYHGFGSGPDFDMFRPWWVLNCPTWAARDRIRTLVVTQWHLQFLLRLLGGKITGNRRDHSIAEVSWHLFADTDACWFRPVPESRIMPWSVKASLPHLARDRNYVSELTSLVGYVFRFALKKEVFCCGVTIYQM
ncbi:hypothetical protein NPIL_58641 [Nephila pilipes]|uniref:Uncharacterized protein n=1 Tax=Nephila pilipes TaxID=299642 RepID=A0A8X6PK02_NEPPI|nr:hypothetical protein NPIL_58641 [Nephila pilipes]